VHHFWEGKEKCIMRKLQNPVEVKEKKKGSFVLLR
jgi:hypothetical protein